MEKFRVRRRDAFHAQNGPINFHENAHIHRFEMLITFSFLKILKKTQLLCYLLDETLAVFATISQCSDINNSVKVRMQQGYFW